MEWLFPRAPVVASNADDVVDGQEHGYAALAAPPSPALEVSIGDDDNDDDSMQVNISCVESTVSQSKKAKFSAELKVSDASVSTSRSSS